MHTPVLFEHPLNEKMRTWLRIEFLIQQMAFRPQIASHADALHFFRNAGDLLDVLERGEVRTDLVKELERQQRKLQSWAEVPGGDAAKVERVIDNRHKEIGGADDRGAITEIVNGGIIAGFVADKQVWIDKLRLLAMQDSFQHFRGNFTTTTGSVAVLR